MSKFKTTFTLIMLFLIAFNFTSTAQLQAKVKGRPIDPGCFLCTPANPNGTVGISVSLKLAEVTFDDCEEDMSGSAMYSGINNLPCDLHVGLTILETGETFYTSVNNVTYQPVDGQDSLMYEDCDYPLSPFEVSGYYTKLYFTIPANPGGGLVECDLLGTCRQVEYFGYSFNILLDFYCATNEGYEPVDFCGPEFEPLIEGIKNCDESKTRTVTVCCDEVTEQGTPFDPGGGSDPIKTNNNNPKAEDLNKVQFGFNEASVSISNLNSTENFGFEIINLNGQIIKRGQILTGSSIHTILYNAEMQTGIYFIRVYNSEGIVTKKFFKS